MKTLKYFDVYFEGKELQNGLKFACKSFNEAHEWATKIEKEKSVKIQSIYFEGDILSEHFTEGIVDVDLDNVKVVDSETENSPLVAPESERKP